MRVAGLGFRKAADLAALREALMAAGGLGELTALATAAEKAKAPVLLRLAEALGLPVLAVAPDALGRQRTLTQSARVAGRFGTGSVAEASALAAAGPGARLIGPRAVSSDGMATAAIAERAK